MHVVLVHPNYHSGGAEIAGNWPPAWAAYLAGGLKSAGYDKVTFIDAMTDDLPDEVLEQKLREANPDVIGVTSITPRSTRRKPFSRSPSRRCRRRCACWAACMPRSCTSRC